MNPEDIIKLIEAAKANGVSRLKSGDLEFSFGAEIPAPASSLVPVLPQSHPQPMPDEDAEINHKVEELKSVMQLDDTDLINRMFPLPQEEQEAEAV